MKIVFFVLGAFCCSPAFANDVLKKVAHGLKGKWISLSCELRPTEARTEGAPITPTWLKREFTYDGKNNFTGIISIFGDPLCSIPVTVFSFAGTLEWKGDHPVANTAQKLDYILNKDFTITPKAQAFADQLNSLPAGACGDKKWEVNKPQSILNKACALFNIGPKELVKDHDLVYLYPSGPHAQFLFMGAKHVTGQGFYKPELRPPGGLQVPLVRAP